MIRLKRRAYKRLSTHSLHMKYKVKNSLWTVLFWQINGVNVERVTHDEAVDHFMKAGAVVRLKVILGAEKILNVLIRFIIVKRASCMILLNSVNCSMTSTVNGVAIRFMFRSMLHVKTMFSSMSNSTKNILFSTFVVENMQLFSVL